MKDVHADIECYLSGEKELAELIGIAPEYMARLRGRAQFYLDGGHHERALIMLEMLEALDRRDKLPTLHAIDVLLALGRSTQAQEKVDGLLARDPRDPDALVAQAEVRLAAGELVHAARLLEHVISRDAQAQTAAGQRARAVAAEAHARLEASR